MSATRLALAALALLLSAGCAAPIETGFDHDDEQDFSGYTTYQWQQPAESVLTKHVKPVSNDLLDARVKSAVNADESYENKDSYGYLMQKVSWLIQPMSRLLQAHLASLAKYPPVQGGKSFDMSNVVKEFLEKGRQ